MIFQRKIECTMSTRTVRASSKGAASAMATRCQCAASVKTARPRNSSAQNDDPKRQRTKNAVAQEKVVKERACKAVDNEGESSQELAPKQSTVGGGAAEEKEHEEEDIESAEETDVTDKFERDVVEVSRVELTVQEKDIIAAKRTEKIKRKRKLERERGQDAKTQNDADGWPMPETKTKIAEMTKAERMGVGLRFTTKFSLLSRLMAISEYDKKRFTLTESRPLSVVAACPFAGEQGCPFEMRAAFRAAERFNSYRDLTFEDKELSVARGKTLSVSTEDPSPISKKKPPISAKQSKIKETT